MLVFDVGTERVFDPVRHVEKVLGTVDGGDVTIACWEPGQVSPNHLHPNATEIYFCFEGGGVMRTPEGSVVVTPGSFVVHPPGELHDTRMARPARSCFECATGRIFRRGQRTGRAIQIGEHVRRILHISLADRSGPDVHRAHPGRKHVHGTDREPWLSHAARRVPEL